MESVILMVRNGDVIVCSTEKRASGPGSLYNGHKLDRNIDRFDKADRLVRVETI
ncbi:hypothetical protein [Paenibacillus sp. Marseille-Q9583]